MRRAIIFLILLVLMCGIAFFIYYSYSNHEQIADLNDMQSRSRVIENGTFSGQFKHNTDSIKIKRFSYEIIEDDLYISIYIGSGGEFMETDEDGYVTVEIGDLPEIDKIYYDNGDAATVMPTSRY